MSVTQTHTKHLYKQYHNKWFQFCLLLSLPPFPSIPPCYIPSVHKLARACVCVCMCGVREIQHNHILFLRFYAYMFVDLVKRSVLTLVSEIYSTTEMIITIITCLHPHTSTDIKQYMQLYTNKHLYPTHPTLNPNTLTQTTAKVTIPLQSHKNDCPA